MYLTNEEEAMLRGDMGEVIAQSMRLLETIGKAYGAEKLIPVKSVHVSGISYNTISEAGLEYLRNITSEGVRCRTLTTINPAGMELGDPDKLNIPREFAEKQYKVVECFEKIKAKITCSCTPYLCGNRPLRGDHIAWAESSAVVFANSILGAPSNREGGPASLASALTGRTPYYGYHMEENRRPNIEISLELELRDELDFSLLGYVIGERVAGVPFIRGKTLKPSLKEIKVFGAGAAASGDLALYHWENATPESRRYRDSIGSLEHISVERRDLEEVLERLSTAEHPDAICLGCPHLSLSEVWEIASMLRGRRLNKRLFCFTSRMVYHEALKRGLISDIERAGGKVIQDTCMVVSPLKNAGIHEMETNSCKAAYYSPNLNGVSVRLSDMKSSLQGALG